MSSTTYRNYKTEEEVREDGVEWQDSASQCTKNNHHLYTTVAEFESHLDPHYRSNHKIPRLIRHTALLVVMIRTPCLGPNGALSFRYGSGIIQRVRIEKRQECPVKNCKTCSRNREYGIITVTTVLHVITSQSDAEKTTALLDFDDENAKGRHLQGFKLQETEKDAGELDWCAVEFYTHDLVLVSELKTKLADYHKLQAEVYSEFKDKANGLVIVVGHPHGGPKKISFGEVGKEKGKEIKKDVREQQEWCQYRYSTATCPGSSGSTVYILGQPLCGYGYWFGHGHNHSAFVEDARCGSSSVGVDNVVR
ncbi:uncharacterized protein LOC131956807 [Physella acuta]|uniref:uncharacterized protein LOC131956807 n=1 Tax=Physella acuta TaxID=109671 RepID=UPI0027DCC9B0|nr:uncharacterized protein LOC131956807 [Physella acuta]